jgi:molecular chaperone DnaK (HSP70)
MIVGIDLGTTFSLTSKLGSDGRPILIPDSLESDYFATPSVVHLSDKTAIVGNMCEDLISQNPDLPVQRFFKRHFGIPKPLAFDKNQQPWYPETLGALILKKLKNDIEHFDPSSIEGAVITVPAHFNDAQRKSVLNAGALADLPIIGLVEEPISAALHYTVINKVLDKIVLVYDLGGGTFDSTLLSMDLNGTYVLSKEGITELGGKEFDEKIGEFILDNYKRYVGFDLELNAVNLLQLRKISEEIKIELSLPQANILRKSILLGDKVIDIIFNRKNFENSIKLAIDQTIDSTIRCLSGASLKAKDVQTILLVGGSSMIPYVRERLKEVFNEPHHQIMYHEPMKAVAFGASIYGAQISGKAKAYDIPSEFMGITGYNIGIKTIDPESRTVQFDTLVKKNLPLPVRATRTYYTSSANQKTIELEVYQYDNEKSSIHFIGKLTIGPIQNNRVNYPIEVTITNTEDGVVLINAFDPSSGQELEQTFGMDDELDNYLTKQKRLIDQTVINNIV